MEEIKIIIETVVDSWIFKTILGSMFTTLVVWGMVSVRNTSNKIKDSLSKKDLDKGIEEAKHYTDEQIGVHEKDHDLIQEKIKDIKEDTTRIELNQQNMNKKLDTLILQLANK